MQDESGARKVSHQNAPAGTMSLNKFLKCTCALCAGHIEYPAEGVGQTIPCPHCGGETELTLASPEPASAGSARSLKWMVAGVIILIVGVVGVVGAMLAARHLLNQSRASRPASPSARINARNSVRTATETPAAPVINEFVASPVAVEKTPGSTIQYAAGMLKNETARQRFGVSVEIDLFDPSGVKVGSAKDYVAVIEPRAEWKFRALLVKGNISSARVAQVREQP